MTEDISLRSASLDIEAAGAAACRKCAIGNERRNNVYGEGAPRAPLMIVGAAPGPIEDSVGRPFAIKKIGTEFRFNFIFSIPGPSKIVESRSTELLDRMMAAIGLCRHDLYLCYLVKCCPHKYEGIGRPVLEHEIANCLPYLQKQIDIVRPRMILGLGATVGRALLGTDFRIKKQHGRWFEGPHAIPLMVTFDPGYLARLDGDELKSVKRMVWGDLKGVRARLDAAS